MGKTIGTDVRVDVSNLDFIDIFPLSVIEALDKLSHLHQDERIIWTIGSGERWQKQYGGIAYLPDSNGWKDISNWYSGNDLGIVLTRMIKGIDKDR